MNKPKPQSASDAEIIAATERWLEKVVIGLNLCPFARQPWQQGQVRIKLSQADTEARLAQDLVDALLELDNTDPEICETTLLVHPAVLEDFDRYNDFLDTADALLQTLGLDGVIQIASFHPDYCFAGTEAEDTSNLSNRSPWPILHLLREASIEAAISSQAQSQRIVERNIATLKVLGLSGWKELMAAESRH